MQALAGTSSSQWMGLQIPGMTVIEAELAAVTGDDCDEPMLDALVPVLKRLRSAFGMEMVFIGQMRQGALTGRRAAPEQGCHPFEEKYGRDLLKERCGSSSVLEAVPVCGDDGIESGTLVCGVSVTEGYQPPPDSLRSVSRLLASSMRKIKSNA